MDEVGVVAVVGACRPERTSYAKWLAESTNRVFLPASRIINSPNPLGEAVALASWTLQAEGVVIEVPDEVPATDLIGTFADPYGRTRLLGLVSVVDAAHMFDDLNRDDYLPMFDISGATGGSLFIARAQLTVLQIEFASVIMLVNWESLPTNDLSVVMALLNHLNPQAHLKLSRSDAEPFSPDPIFSTKQDRAGWLHLLNGFFNPHITDQRVSALRYEQIRPLHPTRIKQLLDDRIEPGEFGNVIRSVGFCRLATRPNIVAQWEHVGRVISFTPLAIDDHLDDERELLALGQEIAVIGLDLDHEGLIAAFDEAALTDDELIAGPESWKKFSDPFPVWETAVD